MKRRALVFGAGCALAAGSAVALRPSRRAAESYAPIKLEEQVPRAFKGWTIDRLVIPVLPDPSLQARLDAIYNQVLARTYVNAERQRVMLSIAYGEDQGTDATAVHRPEFCYSAQGFSVSTVGETKLRIGERQVLARRVLGTMGGRYEPITYWVTLNDRAVLPGIRRKFEQIRLGLSGLIPDGMLVRVSTISLPLEQSFAVQGEFLLALHDALAPELRSRYFGSVRPIAAG